MGMTFREAIAAVEVGLIRGDQLPDIATTGLLEGYESRWLAALAGESSRRYDSVECHRLWKAALDELGIQPPDHINGGRALVLAYARLVVDGELSPRLGAEMIVEVHAAVQSTDCDSRYVGDCLGASKIIGLFYEHDDCGFLDEATHGEIDSVVLDECRRLVGSPAS